jgi:putative transposase
LTDGQCLEGQQRRPVAISRDGRGRALDKVFIERLWRSLKYQRIDPSHLGDGQQGCRALSPYFHLYT